MVVLNVRSFVIGARETTIVPTQALYLMNSATVEDIAASLAERVWKSVPGPKDNAEDTGLDARLRLACQLVFGRPPHPYEAAVERKFIVESPRGELAFTWTRVCRALLSSAEFRYLN